MTETLFDPLLTTYRLLPSGVIAIPSGVFLTPIGVPTTWLVWVSMTETLLDSTLAT